MKKNVLIITDYAAPYEGNFVMSLKKLEELIIKDGGNFYYIFTSKAKGFNWIDNLNNVTFLENNVLENIKIINNFIKKNEIDVMYSHFCLPRTQLAIKITRLMNRKVKLLQHFHNHYCCDKNFIKRCLYNFIFEGDINIGCSKGVADSIPYKRKKVIYINNGIDFSRLENYKYEKLGKEEEFSILMFGYTYKRKAVDLAIKAIIKLNNTKIKLLISLSKDEEKFKEEIVKEFGKIPDFVTILKPRNDIATYYKNVDLFISPSREEGLCYSPLEAMYCGIPCICSDIDGHATNIPDLLLFDNENIEQLGKLIQKVYDGNNSFNSEKVKKFLVGNYSVDRWGEQIINIIYKLDY